MKKKLISYLLLLVCMLCFVGCKKNDSKNNASSNGNQVTGEQSQEKTEESTEAKGRYVETPCGTLDNCSGLFNLTKMDDGSLAVLDVNSGSLFQSKDGGESFTATEVKQISSLLGKVDIEFTSGTISSKGEIFFSYILWNEVKSDGNPIENYVYIDADGKESNPKLQVSNTDSWLYGAQFSPTGELFGLTNTSEIVSIDPKKENAEVLFTGEEYIENFAVSDAYIAVVDNKVGYLYDLETKKLEKVDDTMNTFLSTSIKEDQSCKLAFDTNNEVQ